MKELPHELLYHIFSYLDLMTIYKNIQLVNHAFNNATLLQISSVFEFHLWKLKRSTAYYQSEIKQNMEYKNRINVNEKNSSFSTLEKIIMDINKKNNSTPITKFSLNFCGCLVKPIKNLLSLCPNIENLSLRGNIQVNDRMFKNIETEKCMNNIKILNISSCRKITDEGINTICTNMTNLSDINIRGNYKLTDQALLNIANKLGNKLIRIDIQGLKGITITGVREIGKKCTSLEYLNMQHCPIKIEPDVIVGLIKLKYFNINYCGLIDDYFIEKLMQYCKELYCLEIQSQTNLTNKGFKTIQNLKRLNAAQCYSLNNHIIQILGYNNKILEELELKNIDNITYESVVYLENSQLKRLRILNLSATSVDKNILDLLFDQERRQKSFPSLKILNLSECKNIEVQYQKVFFFDNY